MGIAFFINCCSVFPLRRGEAEGLLLRLLRLKGDENLFCGNTNSTSSPSKELDTFTLDATFAFWNIFPNTPFFLSVGDWMFSPIVGASSGSGCGASVWSRLSVAWKTCISDLFGEGRCWSPSFLLGCLLSLLFGPAPLLRAWTCAGRRLLWGLTTTNSFGMFGSSWCISLEGSLMFTLTLGFTASVLFNVDFSPTSFFVWFFEGDSFASTLPMDSVVSFIDSSIGRLSIASKEFVLLSLVAGFGSFFERFVNSPNIENLALVVSGLSFWTVFSDGAIFSSFSLAEEKSSDSSSEDASSSPNESSESSPSSLSSFVEESSSADKSSSRSPWMTSFSFCCCSRPINASSSFSISISPSTPALAWYAVFSGTCSSSSGFSRTSSSFSFSSDDVCASM